MSGYSGAFWKVGARLGGSVCLTIGMAWVVSPSSAQTAELLTVPEPSLATLEISVQGQLRQEREDLEEVLAVGDADGQTLGAAFGRMGQLYLVYDVAGAAEPCLINASRLMPEDFRWPHYLGGLYVNAGDLEKARRAYEKAVELGPRYVASRLRLGQVLFELGDSESAQETFQQVLSLAPASAVAHQGLGRIAQERQQYPSAIEHFQKALELQPEAASLHHELAMAYRQLGDEDLARENLGLYEDKPVQMVDPVMAALQTLVQGPEVHFNRGVDALRGGDAGRAIEEFEATIELDPADAMAHYYLALAVLRTWRGERLPQQLDRALSELRRALELRPEYRDAHYVLGSMLGQVGELDEARDHLEEAHRIDPDYLNAHLEWAIALSKTGEADRALSEMSAIAEANPTFARAQIALATLLNAQDRHREALEHYRLAVQHEKPLSSETVLAAATLAGQVGRFQESATFFETAVGLEPTSAEAHLGWALALILEGNDSETNRVLEASRRALPDDLPLAHLQARFLATCSDDATRDGSRALEMATEIHRRVPSLEHAETVAMALAAEGRFDEAVRWQMQVVEELENSDAAAALEVAAARLDFYRAGQPVRSPWLTSRPGS